MFGQACVRPPVLLIPPMEAGLSSTDQATLVIRCLRGEDAQAFELYRRDRRGVGQARSPTKDQEELLR